MRIGSKLNLLLIRKIDLFAFKTLLKSAANNGNLINGWCVVGMLPPVTRR